MATVGVHGAGAVAIVGSLFEPAAGRPLETFDFGRVVFGRFHAAANVREELVVGLISAQEVEIHCHGGSAAVEAIREALVQEGCLWMGAGQWAYEAAGDPLAAESLLALAQARTERTAANLLDQYRGALRRELCEVQAAIEQGEITAAKDRLKRLTERADLGLHLTEPWRIVLAGRPNAGKSSLMNAIVGYERAIVYSEPGTTRDVLTATTALEGWPVELSDTAGIRAPSDALEAGGVTRARAEVSHADLVLLVADTTAHWDAEFYRELSGMTRRLAVVHNKCDLAPPPADGRPAGFVVSAKTGAGVDALCQALAERLVPHPPPRGAGVPFTADQVAAMNEIAVLLNDNEPAVAQSKLAAMLARPDLGSYSGAGPKTTFS